MYLEKQIIDKLEPLAVGHYDEMIVNNSINYKVSTLVEVSTIKNGKLNSEAELSNRVYHFFTCPQ